VLNGEHQINPVLYFEYENINEASRIQKEVLGHAEHSNVSLQDLKNETAREIEAKLILSSDIGSWNIARNQAIKVSPGFGLTANSDRMLLRLGYTYELSGFGRKISRMFRSRS
jgi:hypothetical protein